MRKTKALHVRFKFWYICLCRTLPNNKRKMTKFKILLRMWAHDGNCFHSPWPFRVQVQVDLDSKVVMMSSAPAKCAGDARYASQDPFIRWSTVPYNLDSNLYYECVFPTSNAMKFTWSKFPSDFFVGVAIMLQLHIWFQMTICLKSATKHCSPSLCIQYLTIIPRARVGYEMIDI